MFDNIVNSLPLPAPLKNLAGAGGGKTEKATIYVKKLPQPVPVKVQFNPSEYTITRGVQVSKEKGVGTEPNAEKPQTVNAETSTLQVSLYFDSLSPPPSTGASLSSLTALGTNAKKAYDQFSAGDKAGALGTAASAVGTVLKANPKVNAVCDKFLSLVKFDPEQHGPPTVIFVWSQYLAFGGVVQSSTVQYTMFLPNGTPVRAKVNLTIVGEEMNLSQQAAANPNESPDRTKDRLLPFGDQLWMVANNEYGDPGQWKVIAEANDILNPRKIDRAIRLKVPSIR